MKIATLKATRVSVPLQQPARFATRLVTKRDYTIVELTTDDGLTGIGLTWWHHPALIIENHLKQLIIGEDPLAIERIWHKMYCEVYRERKGAAICAISALDIALWEIIGKALKQPVYKLLGGFRDRVPCYASGGYYREGKGLQELAKEMEGFVAAGFTAVKVKVGGMPTTKDVERVKAARKAIGSEVQLMIDANNAYTPAEAMRAGRLYEKHRIEWFEEPVWPDDIGGCAQVAAALDTPIAAGELEYTRYGFRELFEQRAVDIVQPDVMFCGGITELMKVAKMASAWNLPLAPHAAHDISVHCVAACPNGLTVEYFLKESDIMKEAELFEQTLQPKNGILQLPGEPGLGIHLDQRAIRRYRVK